MFVSKQDELIPKKKFTFATRKKERDPPNDSNIPGEDKPDETSIPLLISNASLQYGFSNKQGEKLSMQVCMYHTHAYIKHHFLLLS